MSSRAAGQEPGASSGSTRTIKHAVGETIVESGGHGDHVIIRDAEGKTTAESWCEPGAFDAYVALFTALKSSTGRGDRTGVVKMIAYPLRVNAKKPRTVRDEAALSKAYDRVFTPRVLDMIAKAEPAAVFCRNGQGMLGNGVVWARVSDGTAKVRVINP